MEQEARMPFLIDFDYVEEESDEDRRGQDSSEDELDIILHGTPKQKRKLSRSLSRGSLELSSSEDDFEKDMERELNETVRRHEECYSSPKDKAGSSGMEVTAAGTSSTQPKTQSLAQQFYDDIYFDSDGSDSGQEGDAAKKQKKDKKQKDKNRIIPDDELMYDPNIDDENQRWVDRQRQKYRNQQAKKAPPGKPDANKDTGKTSEPQNGAKESGPSTSSVPAQPKSDAILNCPACLTTLCLDCQRHELYHNQYRAMFVLNCTITKSERLKYPVPKKNNKKWKRNRGNKRSRDEGEGSVERTVADENSDEFYFPVKCSECNTEVAVYDEDEVFHFFNVLTSLA